MINGIIGIAQPWSNFFINIEIAVPEMTLPNKRKDKDIGKVNSDMIFIGSITGFGSKKPFKYPPIPFDAIPDA